MCPTFSLTPDSLQSFECSPFLSSLDPQASSPSLYKLTPGLFVATISVVGELTREEYDMKELFESGMSAMSISMSFCESDYVLTALGGVCCLPAGSAAVLVCGPAAWISVSMRSDPSRPGCDPVCLLSCLPSSLADTIGSVTFDVQLPVSPADEAPTSPQFKKKKAIQSPMNILEMLLENKD